MTQSFREAQYILSSKHPSFTPFAQDSGSHTAYALQISRFVLMLLRLHTGQYDAVWTLPRDASEISDTVTALGILLAAEPRDQNTIKSTIHTLLFLVWTRPYKITAEDKFPDPSVRFVMFQSMHFDGSHSNPTTLTPILSKMKHNIRLVLGYEIGCGSHLPHTAREEMERYQLLEKWVREGLTDSPFHTICSIQHVASNLVFATPGRIHLFWPKPDDHSVLNYHGDEIRLSSLHDVVHSLEVDMKTQFEELTMGVKVRVNCAQMHDDLSKTTVGYSFIDNDPSSKLRGSLLCAIFGDAELKNRWLYPGVDGMPEWNLHEAASWLHKYSLLSKNHLTRIELLSGGPIRGTEITGAQHRATAFYQERNLVVIGKHLVFVGRYGKTSGRTGHDKMILHSLDAFTSDLLLQDLALLRPFAEFLAARVYPDSGIDLLYHNNLFVNRNRLFTSDDLTVSLKELTNKFMVNSYNLQDIRHIMIAFRRRNCTHTSKTLDDDIQEGINAEQAGHTLQVEQRLYGISTDAILTHSEGLLPMYLEASSEWQMLMDTVPGSCFDILHINLLILNARWFISTAYGSDL